MKSSLIIHQVVNRVKQESYNLNVFNLVFISRTVPGRRHSEELPFWQWGKGVGSNVQTIVEGVEGSSRGDETEDTGGGLTALGTSENGNGV